MSTQDVPSFIPSVVLYEVLLLILLQKLEDLHQLFAFDGVALIKLLEEFLYLLVRIRRLLLGFALLFGLLEDLAELRGQKRVVFEIMGELLQ